MGCRLGLGSWFATTSLLAFTAAPSATAQTTENEPPQAAQQNADVAARAADDAAQGDGEIIVYGLKGARSQELQRAPISVTAIDTATLDRTQAVSVADIGKLVPNASLTSSGSYGQFPAFQIRGVGVALSTPTVDPAVTVSIDGMPYAMPPGTIVDTFDLETLEVLRGPQGVFQGRNATGGVVSLRTRRPTDNVEARVQATVGNYRRFDVGALLSGPLIEGVVRGKLAVIRRRTDAFYQDKNGGTFVPAPSNPSGTDPSARLTGRQGNETWLVRPTLSVEPANNLTLTFLGEYVKQNGVFANGQPFAPQAGVAPTLLPQFGYTPPADAYEINANLPSDTKLTSWRGIGEIVWDVDRLGVFTSVTGYRKAKYLTNLDSDQTPFVILQFPDNSQRGTQFSQEVRFASTFSDKVDLLVGGYYSNYDIDIVERRQNTGLLNNRPHLQYRYQQALASQQQESLAGFANIGWHATDRLTLSAGGRYSWERKEAQIVPLSTCSGVGYAACPIIPVNGGRSYHDFSPRVGVDFQSTERLLFYASYTKGFRSGAFNSRATAPQAIGPSAPESVTSYEAGMKATFWDNLLRLNVAAFHSKYDDIQRTLTINTFSFLTNAASATINGLEAEARLRPVKGLELNANAGYVDARYDAFPGLDLDGTPGNQPADDQLAKKLKFPNVPAFTLFLAANYTYELPGQRRSLAANVSFSHRGPIFLDTLNIPVSYEPSYDTLDANISLNLDKVRLTAFARNLTDARSTELVSVFFGAAPITYTRFGGTPRTFGVEALFTY